MHTYRVAECYDTIQGEGRYAGTPMVLLRLQGCGVGCSWCDTKFSWPEDKGALGEQPATALVELVRQRTPRDVDWVLVTGGEPAEQDLTDLAEEFKRAGWRLALETSGTAPGHLWTRELWDWICVSPKENMPGGKPILSKVVTTADELKFVIGKAEHLDAALAFLERYVPQGGKVVSLQPLSENEKATKLCVEAALRHGFNLSLQQHKLLGLQ